MTTVAVIVAAIAAVAALRRLARIAVALLLVALGLVGGPSVLAELGQLEDPRAQVPDAFTGASGATKPRAVDGDTFNLDQAGRGGKISVRVALVDAGEISSTRYGRPTCGGKQAKRFATRWAARQSSVRLQPVAGLPREDRYGRRLGRITGRRGDYGLAVVRRGWARVVVYESPRGQGAAYLARLRRAEAAARNAPRGGWVDCEWGRKPGVE